MNLGFRNQKKKKISIAEKIREDKTIITIMELANNIQHRANITLQLF